jgi:uncharacterized protein YoxC
MIAHSPVLGAILLVIVIGTWAAVHLLRKINRTLSDIEQTLRRIEFQVDRIRAQPEPADPTEPIDRSC